MSKRQHKTIIDLPFELWYTIINFLDHSTDITSLILTCKCLHRLFSHPTYGKVEYVIFDLRHKIRCDDIPDNARLFVRNIRLSVFATNDIWDVVKTFTMLTQLYCHGCEYITSIPSLPNLKLLLCNRCDRITTIPSMPKLESLECIQCTNITTISSMDELRCLNCSFCFSLKTIGTMLKLKDFFYAKCVSLKEMPKTPYITHPDHMPTETIPIERLKRLYCTRTITLLDALKRGCRRYWVTLLSDDYTIQQRRLEQLDDDDSCTLL